VHIFFFHKLNKDFNEVPLQIANTSWLTSVSEK